MNIIFYFSGSGKSRRLAEYLGKKLGFSVINIIDCPYDFSAELAVVVFPVYCQNIPEPMKAFLSKLKAEKVAFAVTYGKKSYGNVIEEAANLTNSEFIGGVCVPCGHSFLFEPDDFDFASLMPFIERINNPQKAEAEHSKKDFYANIFPAQRTAIGIKINRNVSCIECGNCSEICPVAAIKNGRINNNCIGCLRCVNECPEKALDFKAHRFLKFYLKKNRKNKIKLFL